MIEMWSVLLPRFTIVNNTLSGSFSYVRQLASKLRILPCGEVAKSPHVAYIQHQIFTSLAVFAVLNSLESLCHLRSVRSSADICGASSPVMNTPHG